MVLLGVLLSLEEKERERGEKDGEFPWKLPLRLGCYVRWVTSTPNYSCLVTSWGRRWRSSQAGTINQRRLTCSQGDWREVFKAGAGAASITVGEAAGKEQHMLPPAHKQDVRLFPTCRLFLLIIKIWLMRNFN